MTELYIPIILYIFVSELNFMLKLVRLNEKNYPLLIDMMDEWTTAEEDIIPWAIAKNDYHNKEKYISELDVKEGHPYLVPDSTFFCLDTDRNIFVGAVNIRHYLNEKLLLNGGHIGDGIRPSERQKGFGAKMVALALEECKKLGIDKVLMVCDKSNIASAKTIIYNGGILENEVFIDGEPELRFWIDIN